MVSTAAPAPRRRVSPWTAFRPKLIDALREGYGFSSLRADVLAGLTVAIVALPLAMALAIASGATPEKGLLTALLAGGLISALSGSRFQIGGPTGAFVVVVFNVIARFGFDGLVLATLMAGALLLAAGFARLGAWIKYIPEPVVAGFTAGIGIVIATSQIRDLLGLSMSHVPADFLAKWVAMWGARASVAPWALVIAAGSLAVIVVSDPRSARPLDEPRAGRLPRQVGRHVGCAGQRGALGPGHRRRVPGRDRGLAPLGAQGARLPDRRGHGHLGRSLPASAGGDHRFALRPPRFRPAGAAYPQRFLGAREAAHPHRLHHRLPGRGGEPVVGRGRRRHDRPAAPPQRRTGRAGRGQPGVRPVRRPSRHRRRGAHGDQRPRRRPLARGWRRPRNVRRSVHAGGRSAGRPRA